MGHRGLDLFFGLHLAYETCNVHCVNMLAGCVPPMQEILWIVERGQDLTMLALCCITCRSLSPVIAVCSCESPCITAIHRQF